MSPHPKVNLKPWVAVAAAATHPSPTLLFITSCSWLQLSGEKQEKFRS